MALNNFDLWRCEPSCAPLNKENKSKKSCLCFPSCLCDSILLRRNGFYINFLCCRFLCLAYPSLSRCVSATLFLLIIFIWQQSTVSYCWFLCGSSMTSFLIAGSCVAAERLPIVGSCVTTIRHHFFMLGQLGWNLKWMCMNDEVLKLSGKWWKWMDIKCYIDNGNG